MTYELVLVPEAVKHLKEWQKSGQKKTLKKIADLFEELRQHPTQAPVTLNSSKEIIPATGVGKSPRATE